MLSNFSTDQTQPQTPFCRPCASKYSRCAVMQRIACTVTWLHSHLTYYLVLHLYASHQLLPSVPLIAISGDVVISRWTQLSTVQIQVLSTSIWVRRSQSMSLPQLQFCFPDCPSLSILRSQWHHVDRATNPENMSKLAVNKERASLRVEPVVYCSIYLPLFPGSLSDTNTQELCCSLLHLHTVCTHREGLMKRECSLLLWQGAITTR